ncbi:ABC transporter ATP-binding protein [Chromatiales bacterium (ex Bugula neritina AB1)]|nr:ABC transporter ATP-binding protein [Chromatiales bacterium (ex Bugula neritina AB1)]
MTTGSRIIETFLDIRQVSKSYSVADGRDDILRGISLTVARAERVALIGASGCGKSTLLNVVAGIDNTDSGSIVLAGTELTALSEKQRTLLRRQHIGFIYQSFNLIQTLTAIENIQLPLQLNGYPLRDTIDQAMVMLERVGLIDRADAFPDQLSGGEQQRIAIARALVHSPSLVLADEHTGNLDSTTGRQVMDLFNELAESTGQTVLMVTHSRAVAETADRVMQIINGRIESSDANRTW